MNTTKILMHNGLADSDTYHARGISWHSASKPLPSEKR